jgi:long-subunit acyl-CoA synthetase (AMP-forming)
MNEKTSLENRIFKLSTGEKVDSGMIEDLIENSCHYVKYAVVSNDEKENIVALIFPNKKLFESPDYQVTPDEGCFCPRSLDELGKCLNGCLKLVNHLIEKDSDKVKFAAIINSSLPDTETTFSPENIIEKYKTLLQKIHKGNVPSYEEIYIIKNE